MKKVVFITKSLLTSVNLKFLLCPALIIFLSLFSSAFASEQSLILGIHPYLTATELIDRFTPLAEYLGRKIGQPVTISISKDYKSHIDNIGNDKVDIAFMGPASYVKMVNLYGEKPLLARLEINNKPRFQGIIVVRDKSELRNLKDLAGKRFAFGDPESTMSHLVPRYMLLNAGIDIDKLSGHAFLSNHNDVALGVLIGDFDAGAVKEDVFHKYEKRGLRLLQRSQEISEHLFVARKGLKGYEIEALRKALYELKDDQEGTVIMSRMRTSLTGLVPVINRDYENLRVMIQKLEEKGIGID